MSGPTIIPIITTEIRGQAMPPVLAYPLNQGGLDKCVELLDILEILIQKKSY